MYSPSLERLRALPRFGRLASSVEKILKGKGDRVEAIALFGSMARGNYGSTSDYDLFIVSEEEGASWSGSRGSPS